MWVQGRITTLAAGYDVDFDALHQDDVRGLNKLLISRVYPEQPDFSAWDAVDDAFARLEEARHTPCCPVPHGPFPGVGPRLQGNAQADGCRFA